MNVTTASNLKTAAANDPLIRNQIERFMSDRMRCMPSERKYLESLGFVAKEVDKGKNRMTKEEALKLIDDHKNKLLNPVEMLNWVWLRVIIANLDDDAWNQALSAGMPALSR